MATPGDSEPTPMWGNTPEFRAYCAALNAQDPHRTTLPDLVKPELGAAKAEGPQAYAEYLNALSGIGTFAVKGTVYVPKHTRAFGDWLLLHDGRNSEITGTEEVETQDDFPYVKGKVAYTVRGASVQRDRGVRVVTEEFVEDGPPRIMYPDELERFDLYHVNVTNILERREQKHLQGILRFLRAQE
jgi:hypothetical protein